MATWDRGYIVKNNLLGFFQRLVLVALLALAPGQPVQAAREPPGVTATSAQAPLRLAWDRVGSPIQIRV